jgi:hypothetical protein
MTGDGACGPRGCLSSGPEYELSDTGNVELLSAVDYYPFDVVTLTRMRVENGEPSDQVDVEGLRQGGMRTRIVRYNRVLKLSGNEKYDYVSEARYCENRRIISAGVTAWEGTVLTAKPTIALHIVSTDAEHNVWRCVFCIGIASVFSAFGESVSIKLPALIRVSPIKKATTKMVRTK